MSTKEVEIKEIHKCIGCGKEAYLADNTLCLTCWHDAEGWDD